LSKNMRRVLRRMHNKVVIVDGKVAVLGGRNVADRYFDLHKKYNFRDRDAVIFGKASISAQFSFNEFWEHDLSIPYTELSGKAHRKRFTNPLRFKELQCYAKTDEALATAIQKRANAYPSEFHKHQTDGTFFWLSTIAFLSDKPGKNEYKPDRKGGLLTDSVVEMIKHAKTSIDILSPYFILDKEGMDLIQKTIQRGVKIRVMTNSMASTDNFEAFSGYHRDRKEILATGVSLYEFKPDANLKYQLMWPIVQSTINYKATYGYHSKTIIIDGHTILLGSYNFDPRSANYNTECSVVIRSEEFANYMEGLLKKELDAMNSWKITKECNPDRKAGLKKRYKVFTRKIIPKKML
jgi:putative cardiolipin synthase